MITRLLIVITVIAITITLILTYSLLIESIKELALPYFTAGLLISTFIPLFLALLTYFHPARIDYWISAGRESKLDLVGAFLWWVIFYSYLTTQDIAIYLVGFALPGILVYVLARYKPRRSFLYSLFQGLVSGFEAYYLVITLHVLTGILPKMSTALTIHNPEQVINTMHIFSKYLSSIFGFILSQEVLERIVIPNVLVTFTYFLFPVTLEELYFRRIIKLYVKYADVSIVVFVSTFLFVIAHVVTRMELPYTEFIITIASIGLASGPIVYSYIHCANLVAPIIAHTTYNTLITIHATQDPYLALKVLPLAIIFTIIYIIVRKIELKYKLWKRIY